MHASTPLGTGWTPACCLPLRLLEESLYRPSDLAQRLTHDLRHIQGFSALDVKLCYTERSDGDGGGQQER